MKGVFINLDSRIDRREHFENTIKCNPLFSNIERISAIECEDRALGCSLSHITALSLYDNTEEPFIAVFEDDFMILEKENLENFMVDFENVKDLSDWQVIVLTPRGSTIESSDIMNISNFRRIIDHQTATGYIVKKEFISLLIQNMKEAIQLQQEGVGKYISATDQYWKPLQEIYPFYYYSKIFAGQLPGWSNIENQQVDYNERFRNQSEY